MIKIFLIGSMCQKCSEKINRANSSFFTIQVKILYYFSKFSISGHGYIKDNLTVGVDKNGEILEI